jgi:tetratricopeptide (TPR) repeat protein
MTRNRESAGHAAVWMAAVVLLGAALLNLNRLVSEAILNQAARQWLAAAGPADARSRAKNDLGLPAQYTVCVTRPQLCQQFARSLEQSAAWAKDTTGTKIHLAELRLAMPSLGLPSPAASDFLMKDQRLAWLADGLYQSGDVLQAQSLLRRLIGWQPGAALSYAEAYRQRGDAEMAVWLLETTLADGSLAPSQQADAEEQLGEIYRKLQPDPPLAILHLQRAIALRGPEPDHNPQNANAYYHLGNVYMVSGDLDKAIEALSLARQLQGPDRPSKFPDLALGTVYRLRGDRAEALAHLCAALQSTNTQAEALNQLRALDDQADPAELCPP